MKTTNANPNVFAKRLPACSGSLIILCNDNIISSKKRGKCCKCGFNRGGILIFKYEFRIFLFHCHKAPLATGMRLSQAGRSNEVKGLYALCPYIAGIWPLPENPSSTENNGIMLDLHNDHGAVVYGIEDWEKRNPLAWPGFAKEEDVKDLPKTFISVNECDPLRDEGINFYRLL